MAIVDMSWEQNCGRTIAAKSDEGLLNNPGSKVVLE